MTRPAWLGSRSKTTSETPEQRRRREAQDEIDRQLRSWPPRRIASWALMTGALIVAVQHLLAHGGAAPLPFSLVRQDIFVGYPTAALMGLVGLILLDPRPRV